MASYTRKLFGGVAIISLLTMFISIFGYLIRIYLAKQLSVEEYGLFYGVMAFVGFFLAFKNLGMGSAISRYIPIFLSKNNLKKTKYVILSTLFIQSLFAIVLSIVLILFSSFISQHFFHTSSAQIVLIFVTLSFLFSVFHDLFASIYTGFQKPALIPLPELLKNIFILFFLWLLFSFNKTAAVPAFAYLLVSLVVPIISFVVFLRIFPGFISVKSDITFFSCIKDYFAFKKNNSLIQKIRNYGFFVFLNSQGWFFITYTDVLALTYLRTLGEVGLYNVAVPLVSLIVFLPYAINGLLLSMISEIYARKQLSLIRNEVQRIQKFSLAAIIPISMMLFAFSDVAIRMLFGEKYVAASIVLKILSIGTIFNALGAMNVEILNGIGKTATNSKILFKVAVLNLILCLFFVKQYGMVAAALATSISYLLIFVLNSNEIRKNIGPSISASILFRLIISGAVFLTVLFLFKLFDVNIWIKIISAVCSAAIIYVLTLFLLRIITKKEIKMIVDRIKR